MRCTLEESSELWSCLLALRAQGIDLPVWLSRGPHAWALHDAPQPAELCLALHDPSVPANWPAALQVFVPILRGRGQARARGGVFVTGHLAQTLDGKIACASGDSQWIGNAGNLRHAHRLRALHDAVLVGGRTVDRDNPALTVRHVSGPNPLRVVLNGSGSTLPRRHDLKVYAAPGCVLVCAREVAARAAQAGVDAIALDPQPDGSLPIAPLLAALAARGVHSLFVEGGGQTLSSFLAADALDLLHLHVAPIVLGSGVPTFALPEVGRLRDAQRFAVRHFDVDGELLITCRPASRA